MKGRDQINVVTYACIKNTLSAAFAAGLVLSFVMFAYGFASYGDTALRAAVFVFPMPFPVALYGLWAERHRRPTHSSACEDEPFTKGWWESVFVFAIIALFMVGLPVLVVLGLFSAFF